jgi:gliding motility-associated-like protein
MKKIIQALLFFLTISQYINAQTVTFTIDLDGAQALGCCSVCGDDYWCYGPGGCGCCQAVNMVRTFVDPVPPGNVVTGVTVQYSYTGCGSPSMPTNINGTPVGTIAMTNDCGCGTCYTTAAPASSFPCGMPGYIYGGVNTITGAPATSLVCIDRVQVTLTYAPAAGLLSVAPTSATANPNPLCGGSTTLTVNGGSLGSGATWNWYTGSRGGTLVGTGASIVVSPAVTTTYFVRAQGPCNTTTCVSVTVNVNTPSTPAASINATVNPICGGSTTLSVVGGSLGTGANWQWYTGSCGGTPAGTGTSITVSPAVTTTYFVRAEGTCGNTTCAQLTVTVNTPSTPAASINATVNPICGGSTTLSVVGGSLGTGANWQWYSGTCGGTFEGSGNSITVSPLVTTTYFVRAEGACGNTLCTQITITVNNISTPATGINANPALVCNGAPSVLTVVGGTLGTGADWIWYENGCGSGVPIGNGNSITVTPTVTTTYFVRAEGTCGNTSCVSVTVTIGASPAAQFNNTTVCSGSATQFTDQSGAGVTTWQWDFGDGNTSNLQNPQHTYAAAGVYNVQLIVSDASGCTGNTTQTVVVNENPTAAFSVTPACPGSNIIINNTSAIGSGTINFNWMMTGASPASSTQTNPVVQYSGGGTYTIDLVVTSDQGCISTVSEVVNIPYMPVPNFSFTEECFGTANSFTDLSTVTNGTIVAWTWIWGDGNPVGNTQNPTHLYGAPGQYQVTLVPTTDAGCTGPTITLPVNVFTNPTASFTVQNICLGQNITVNNTSVNGVNYQWDFGDGNTSNLQNPTHTYNSANAYTISLIVSSGSGCSDTTTQTVTVNEVPQVNFSFTNECINNPITFTDLSTVVNGTINQWQWDFGDGNNSISQNPIHQYNNPNSYNVSLTVTSDQNCSSTLTQQVTAYPLPLVQFSANNVCLGAPTLFQNQSSVSSGNLTNYVWDFGDGNNSLQNSPQHTYANDGTYTVTLVVSTDNNCVDSVTQNVIVNPVPVINFTVDRTDGCSELCVNFTNNSTISSGIINQYIWNFSDGQTSTQVNPSLCFSNSGTNPLSISIGLTAISNAGCQSTISQNNLITVNPVPVAAFMATPQTTTTVNPEIHFTDMSVSTDQWYWDFGDNGASSMLQNPVHIYSQEGTYTVYLISSNVYGCQDTAYNMIVVNPEFILYVPNSFTPDGNGKNDIFYPVVSGYEENSFEFYIFNRWGEIIYESRDPLSAGWDGTHKDMRAKEDVYVWKIKVIEKGKYEVKVYTGHVTLLRGR